MFFVIQEGEFENKLVGCFSSLKDTPTDASVFKVNMNPYKSKPIKYSTSNSISTPAPGMQYQESYVSTPPIPQPIINLGVN
jgi:hypothetical protein